MSFSSSPSSSSSSPSSSASPAPPDEGDLLTERLVLRPWTPAELFAVDRGERQPHWAPDFPAEGDQVIAGILTQHPEGLTGSGHRQVIERGSGLVVGSIGLFWPPNDGAVDVGYGIIASRRGRGYATEATRAMVAFGLAAPGVEAVTAEVDLANTASVRVLEKAGMTRTSEDGVTARYRTTSATATATAAGEAPATSSRGGRGSRRSRRGSSGGE
ncbi:GNAT family N-acetyltransferase [Streptomyces sp. SBT349]|uniref:GNAT family N-acetyltransferase n=1 Tax=Streptomyces sp. SBT349 TaxID=1580539 RepID=UPI001F2DFA48|nr:GNAT family N-acetyltransferase [Streptomyces sp. SBT349]